LIFQSNTALRPSNVPGRIAEIDREVVENAAYGDPEAIGTLVDRWSERFYCFTDALRIRGREADNVVEEVLHRLAFEAPRFVARPEKLADWLRRTLTDCAGSVVARRSLATQPMRRSSPTGAAFSLLIAQGRLDDGLAYLNAQTPFRFTGVYRLEGFSIANLYLYDRKNGSGSDCSVTRVADTFCVWVQETLSVVQMSDSLTDPRAVGHPKREVVRSYCGGPIRGDEGQLVGTICHFDYEPHTDSLDALPVLDEVGPLLARIIA